MQLYRQVIETPLGDMVTLASDKGICLLEFIDRKAFDKQIELTIKTSDGEIVVRSNPHIDILKKELNAYFKNELKEFTTPIDFIGTDFQIRVWTELLNISYGKTISYQQQANNIGNPKAVRAVANANSKNKVCIIVPCHRVIGSNGLLTGYAGGIDRKRFLLDLEDRTKLNF